MSTRKTKLATRKKANGESKEVRSFGELRQLQIDGTFEGYLTVWDTVDSHNSTFTRGSFSKTIKNRGKKVKIFYDHEHLIGSSVELREDDFGVFGKGKLNLGVDKAKEAYAFMKDGTLEGLSFSFRTMKESFNKDGVREISEVELFEYGPVAFPSNPEALVVSVRSEDFDKTLNEHELYMQDRVLIDSLMSTLDDIWWSNSATVENIMGLLDEQISKFHAAYLKFADEWVKAFWVDNRSAPSGNELALALRDFMQEKNTTTDELASSSSLTLDEVRSLRKGELIEARHKLDELPEAVKNAHQQRRSEVLESLCTQLRGGLTNVEKRRMQYLLSTTEEQDTIDDSVMELFADFNKSLKA